MFTRGYRFVWTYGIQNPMIDFPIKKLVITWGIPHVWTDTHDNGCIISRHIPQSLHNHIPILSHCVLCMYTVFKFHIYIYVYVYINIYIYTYIHVLCFSQQIYGGFLPALGGFTNLRGVVFFQRQGALLLALPLYQTNGVTGEPLGPRAYGPSSRWDTQKTDPYLYECVNLGYVIWDTVSELITSKYLVSSEVTSVLECFGHPKSQSNHLSTRKHAAVG